MNKKLLIGIISFLIVVLLIIGGYFLFQKDKDKDKNNPPSTKIEDVLENGTETVQGDFEVTNLQISSTGSINTVTGNVKNLSDTTQDVKITLMFRDIKSGIMNGINDEIIKGVKAKETKPFSVSIMGDYMKSDIYEVRANPYIVVK